MDDTVDALTRYVESHPFDGAAAAGLTDALHEAGRAFDVSGVIAADIVARSRLADRSRLGARLRRAVRTYAAHPARCRIYVLFGSAPPASVWCGTHLVFTGTDTLCPVPAAAAICYGRRTTRRRAGYVVRVGAEWVVSWAPRRRIG